MYNLEVISKHSNYSDKQFKKYNFNGLDHIGVFKDEPFEIVFKNNSYQKVQVRITIDGIDTLTGELGKLDSAGKMWVVNGYDKLVLKCWQETNNGGGRFIFTNSQDSVITNTQSNLSSLGIIAAAVYVEQAPIQLTSQPSWQWQYPYHSFGCNCYYCSWNYIDWSYGGYGDYYVNCGTFTNTITTNIASSTITLNNNTAITYNPAVGVGETITQPINQQFNFFNPILDRQLTIKYIWWNDLIQQIPSVKRPQSLGFPGSDIEIVNLGNTPRKTFDGGCEAKVERFV